MYHKLPKESWFQKGVKAVDQGLKIYGTAQGLYNIGSAIAAGVRSVAPMLAVL